MIEKFNDHVKYILLTFLVQSTAREAMPFFFMILSTEEKNKLKFNSAGAEIAMKDIYSSDIFFLTNQYFFFEYQEFFRDRNSSRIDNEKRKRKEKFLLKFCLNRVKSSTKKKRERKKKIFI